MTLNTFWPTLLYNAVSIKWALRTFAYAQLCSGRSTTFQSVYSLDFDFFFSHFFVDLLLFLGSVVLLHDPISANNIVVYTGFHGWFNDCRCSGSVAAKQALIMTAPPLCSTVTMTQLCWHAVCDSWPDVGLCVIAKHVQFGLVCLAVFSDVCKLCCLLSLFREKQLFRWHCVNTREYLRPTGLLEVLTLTDQLKNFIWLVALSCYLQLP